MKGFICGVAGRVTGTRTGATAEPGAREADLAAFDRRQIRIQRHILLSVALGLLLGTLDAIVGASAAAPVAAVSLPYAYLLLSALLGGTAAGLGWAMLASLLASVTPAVSSLAVSAFLLGKLSADSFDWGMYDNVGFVVTIFLAGVGGYAAVRAGRRRNVAAGLLGGALLLPAALILFVSLK